MFKDSITTTSIAPSIPMQGRLLLISTPFPVFALSSVTRYIHRMTMQTVDASQKWRGKVSFQFADSDFSSPLLWRMQGSKERFRKAGEGEHLKHETGQHDVIAGIRALSRTAGCGGHTATDGSRTGRNRFLIG